MATIHEKQPLLSEPGLSSYNETNEPSILSVQDYTNFVNEHNAGGNLGFISQKEYNKMKKESNVDVTLGNPVITRGGIYRGVTFDKKFNCFERTVFTVCYFPASLYLSLTCRPPISRKFCDGACKGVGKSTGYYLDEEATKQHLQRAFQKFGLNYNNLFDGLEDYLKKENSQITRITFGNHGYAPISFSAEKTSAEKAKGSGYLFFPNDSLDGVVFEPMFDKKTGGEADLSTIHRVAQTYCLTY